jgi:hypothetical protein
MRLAHCIRPFAYELFLLLAEKELTSKSKYNRPPCNKANVLVFKSVTILFSPVLVQFYATKSYGLFSSWPCYRKAQARKLCLTTDKIQRFTFYALPHWVDT